MADSYHHGDLKQELMKKGLQMLAKEGYDGFSMRKLAQLCGVSHAAPYKHFKDKSELIAAISEIIGEEFVLSMRESINAAPADPRERIFALGNWYVRFMTDNPDYFRFVFMVDHGRPIQLAGGVPERNKPLTFVFGVVKDYYESQGIRGEDFLRSFLGLWSLIHGYTLLLVNHTLQMGDDVKLLRGMIEGYLR